jgi:prolyl oligopeptidase
MKKIIFLLIPFTFCVNTIICQEDPYLWLEEIESQKSMKWVQEQNEKSSKVFENAPGFAELKEQFLQSMNDEEKIDYPSVVQDMVYNFWKNEEHVRGIWRRTKKSLYLQNKCEWETVLDLDALSEKDGAKWVFHGANWLEPNFDRCLISLSNGGTDEDIIREFDVRKKEFVSGGFELPPSKGGAAWVNQDEILIARSYGEGTMTTSGYPRIVKRLKRGQPLDDAEIVFEEKDDIMGVWPGSGFVDGKRRITLYKAISTFSHEIYFWRDNKFVLFDLPNDSEPKDMYAGMQMVRLNSDWAVNGTTFKSGDLVSVNEESLLAGKLDVHLIYHPDSKTSIEGVTVTKDGVLLNTIQNVQSVLYMMNFKEGKWKVSKMDTPQFGKINLIDADRKESGFFYQFSNFITPPTLYFKEGQKTTVVRQGKKKFNADNLEVHQYEVKSKDGTTVPYFIVHKKDIKLDGTNPTLVYAYGGFNVSSTPNYSTRTGIGWLEKGGVYVLANIRGGGEFGPTWHQAAMKEKRQNAYDDFYAVSEDVIKRKISSPKHLGAFGWSNGGLMAGVVATQRPDLFNAVIIGAPLLDMKRYNKMLAGASWMGEFGNPDIEEDWAYIQKYSPYHNVFEDKEYPEVFIITSTKDDRVHPGHARKMAAKMMEQGHPLFYFETIEGGHGASSTNEQAATNEAMMFTYLKMKLM